MKIQEEIKKYNVTDAEIAKMSDEYMGLKIKGLEDTDGYDIVKKSRIAVKNKRVEVEKKRKELKAQSLEYGRAVDGEAKRITGLLEPIETYLTEEETKIDEEVKRIKFAETQKKQLPHRIEKLASIDVKVPDEELLSIDDVQFFTLFNEFYEKHLEEKKLAQEAEEEKIRIAKEELQAEKDRIEQQQIEAKAKEVAEKVRLKELEQARQEAESKAKEDAEQKIKDAEERAAKAEDDARLAKIRAEQEAAKEQADRIAAEKREIIEEQEKAAHEFEMLPDKKKLTAFATAIDQTEFPDVKSKEAMAIVTAAKELLTKVSEYINQKSKEL